MSRFQAMIVSLVVGVAVLVVVPPAGSLADSGDGYGLVDPSSGVWRLYEGGRLSSEFFFGDPGDVPFVGDWDCDDIDTPGLYRQSDGYVYLRNSNTPGGADVSFFFGDPGDVPVAGDFDGDGCDTVSLYRPSNQRFYVVNRLGAGDGGLGAAEYSFVFGNPGDKPFVGDFDGNGQDTPGLHRESTGLVYYRNSNTQGVADDSFVYGDPGDRFVVGDWTGNGVESPGVFRPSNTTTYLRYENGQGNADAAYVGGDSDWIPVAGDFNHTTTGTGARSVPPDSTTTTPETNDADGGSDLPSSTVPSTPSTGSGLWLPSPGVTWQWQLTGSVDVGVDVEMFDVDLFETPVSVVEALHARGRAVVCYLSAGSWEDFRPDSGLFPDSVLGRSNGWPGERWLDVRRLDVLGPIMEARLDLCAEKGFDGVEFDNVDGYANSTGFDLTAADQVAYNVFLAEAAHARGLSAALKNDVEQVAELEPFFDFAINEECYVYDECAALTPFIDAGKAVFHVEYGVSSSEFCPATTALGFSSMRKRLDLDAWADPCW